MRREERVPVQGPVKKQRPDGMSHGGGGVVWQPPSARHWLNGWGAWGSLQVGHRGGTVGTAMCTIHRDDVVHGACPAMTGGGGIGALIPPPPFVSLTKP